ncbi:hypothetical protein GYA93_22500 [Gordonia desulfuricans]|uniref:Uncharacterized protein n=1 Tax=Gordonia desulfuricans TaxID=89051 RepID=A0A7K3LW23_9ACTN|nr:hypothetical protein [Gordonia desulfuricans]
MIHVDRVEGSPGDLAGIRVTLHGHDHQYVVGVVTGKGGPRLVDLQIRSETDAAISPETLRAIPSRRLAHAAAKFAYTHDGKFGTPLLDVGTQTALEHMDDPAEADAEYRRLASAAKQRPEERTARGKLPDSHFQEVAQRVRAAVVAGFPVRETVAGDMHTTVPTLDRWIRKAKDLGYLDEDELPRRKNPENNR